MIKRFFLLTILCMSIAIAKGQDFSIMSAGQGHNGEYQVTIVVSTKRNPTKDAENLTKEYAVRGVMFRGVAPHKGHPGQKPLISDPTIEHVKDMELQAFWREKLYLNYATLEPMSLSVIKNKQTKMYETSARLTIDKESLIKWLENKGIIQGFSNLW